MPEPLTIYECPVCGFVQSAEYRSLRCPRRRQFGHPDDAEMVPARVYREEELQRTLDALEHARFGLYDAGLTATVAYDFVVAALNQEEKP